jgi:class 3 adenylate cyclase
MVGQFVVARAARSQTSAHCKELFEPEIAKHNGRVFKLMGDGLLAEFGSVVDAVECAVVLQRGMAERNAGLPNDQRIDVRIGITLSDVIVDGDDRHGEGVNIAAVPRLTPPTMVETGLLSFSNCLFRAVRWIPLTVAAARVFNLIRLKRLPGWSFCALQLDLRQSVGSRGS